MIEVNKNAKPFDPCESVLGPELLFTFVQHRLVGPHYYVVEPIHDRGKDVLAKSKLGKWTKTLLFVEQHGWVEQPPMDGIPEQTVAFTKKIDDNRYDRLFITNDSVTYYDWLRACEVCKYLPLRNDKESRVVAKHIHEIILHNKQVILSKDGDFEGLMGMLHNPENHDDWEQPVAAPELAAQPAGFPNIAAQGNHFQGGQINWLGQPLHPANANQAVLDLLNNLPPVAQGNNG